MLMMQQTAYIFLKQGVEVYLKLANYQTSINIIKVARIMALVIRRFINVLNKKLN